MLERSVLQNTFHPLIHIVKDDFSSPVYGFNGCEAYMGRTHRVSGMEKRIIRLQRRLPVKYIDSGACQSALV